MIIYKEALVGTKMRRKGVYATLGPHTIDVSRKLKIMHNHAPFAQPS